MTESYEIPLNRWIEYSGGSRPGSNLICFTDRGDGNVQIAVRYVFDWDTGELVELLFDLPMSEYRALLVQLNEQRHSIFRTENTTGIALFEWRLTEEGEVSFRLRGKGRGGSLGSAQYNMHNFSTLLLPASKIKKDI